MNRTELERLRRSFAGDLIGPDHPAYNDRRQVWNGIVDRRPALIARCTSADDVAAAIRFGRSTDLEIAVKCGGHNVMGTAVPDGGLMLDLGRMDQVTVDPARRLARVGGGALLGALDRATDEHGLATTAGNVSYTGVGGLTLGGGMGWLARQLGLACDNVETYTVVTADSERVRASATERPDLFWALRGGGGNFGVVTEFEFRIHPTTSAALLVKLTFDAERAVAPMRAWRDLLADAPRPATLTADAVTLPDGCPAVFIGCAWVGDISEARTYLAAFRAAIGPADAEDVRELGYLDLQTLGDGRQHDGLRRYSAGHYLQALDDAAIDAFLSRGVMAGDAEPDWSRHPGAGFQAYGGRIADVGDDESAFSHRRTLVEYFCGASWQDQTEDAQRIAAARAAARVVEPFASGVYVNAIGDQGEAGVNRAYTAGQMARLSVAKDCYDPDNVFHLNQNIKPSRMLEPA